jgi:hypothetical protein
MTLPSIILTAIDAAVAAQTNSVLPPETVRVSYMESAEDALAAGVPVQQIVDQFNQIATQQ